MLGTQQCSMSDGLAVGYREYLGQVKRSLFLQLCQFANSGFGLVFVAQCLAGRRCSLCISGLNL